MAMGQPFWASEALMKSTVINQIMVITYDEPYHLLLLSIIHH